MSRFFSFATFCRYALPGVALCLCCTPICGCAGDSVATGAAQPLPAPAPLTAGTAAGSAPDAAGLSQQTLSPAHGRAVAAVWQPLAQRLAADGLSGPRVEALLAQLGTAPTQSPMGRKIRALYLRKFFPKPKTARPRQQYYKGVVTEANARLCRAFEEKHRQAFQAAAVRYGVPPSIAVALLFVETRLGTVLADVPENAFHTLASMSICRTPSDISDWLAKMPGYEKHLDWFADVMPKRADWAYTETKALIEHMLRDNVSPASLPGSIYGAVGLCQFMPSNIAVYGADGDGDGRVDLFTVPDAVFSLSCYLARHGWKPGLSRDRQHKLLMAYNHSTTYANTILALADLVGGHAAQAPSSRSAATGRRKGR